MIISTCKSTSYLYICYCLDIAYIRNYNPTLEKKKKTMCKMHEKVCIYQDFSI